MDNNQFKGNWHEFKGEVKRKWGKITDNDLLECEGDYGTAINSHEHR